MSVRQYRLLFVEDEVDAAPELVEILELGGFAVDTAKTGLEADELLKHNQYDAVVLDNMMPPGGDKDSEWSLNSTEGGLHTGLQVLRKLDELKSPPPVWVVTALPDPEIEAEERRFPFVKGYSTKPTSLVKLGEDISEYLEENRGHE